MSRRKNKNPPDRQKVFVDTNVWLSAIYWPQGKASQVVWKLLSEYHVFISDDVVAEIKRKAPVRFPGQLWRVDNFFQTTRRNITILTTPEKPVKEELSVTDEKDHPIVRAAIYGGVDMILSGDHHLKEAGLVHPIVLSVREFLELHPDYQDFAARGVWAWEYRRRAWFGEGARRERRGSAFVSPPLLSGGIPARASLKGSGV